MAEPIWWQDAWWYQQPDGTWMRFNASSQSWEPQTPQGTQGTQGIAAYAPSPGMSAGAKAGIAIAIGVGVLFVLLIIAAIAIPVFLRQRDKGAISQTEAVLKNAAVAQESHCTRAARPSDCYTDSTDELVDAGLVIPPAVDLVVVRAAADGYCIEARHELVDTVYSLDSTVGNPRAGPC